MDAGFWGPFGLGMVIGANVGMIALAILWSDK